jgi:hypothetical protein
LIIEGDAGGWIGVKGDVRYSPETMQQLDLRVLVVRHRGLPWGFGDVGANPAAAHALARVPGGLADDAVARVQGERRSSDGRHPVTGGRINDAEDRLAVAIGARKGAGGAAFGEDSLALQRSDEQLIFDARQKVRAVAVGERCLTQADADVEHRGGLHLVSHRGDDGVVEPVHRATTLRGIGARNVGETVHP